MGETQVYHVHMDTCTIWWVVISAVSHIWMKTYVQVNMATRLVP